MKASLLGIDATSYRPHALHAPDRAWPQTNCYVDLWIEVLAAHGLDPHASLPFTFALDFEGDQFLFFKQPTADLATLYGVDIQELTIYRPLVDHAVEQTRRGRMLFVELDAHYLPDTTGLTYRTGHSKTTIGIESIDLDARTLGYFHNDGYFTLSGEDFVGLFGLDTPPLLPPYTEFVKLDRLVRRDPDDLRARSIELLRAHLARRPSGNPVALFGERLASEVAWLSTQPNETFHLYSFATLRQLGAASELSASYLRWLAEGGEAGLERATDACMSIANGAKSLQFLLARATMRKKPLDAAATLGELASAWDVVSRELISRYGR